MSTTLDTKTAIAAALSTVEGVTGYPSRPRSLKPGDAFVRWAGWTRADGTAYMSVFNITLILPQLSEDAADAEAYRIADQLGDVLQPLLFVDSFTPSLVPVDGAQRGLFALTISGRTE
jgi:hypothetical protein